MSEISLSIEETNKLRLSLGLRPIPVGNVNEQKNDTETETGNQQNTIEDHQTTVLQKEREESLKRRLQEAQDKAARKRKSLGKTLHDLEDIDTDSWLNNLGVRKKKTKTKSDVESGSSLSNSKEETSEEMEGTGIKITHSAKDLESVSGDILTLKDSGILDEDEEELHNDTISRQNKVRETLRERAAAESVKFIGRNYRQLDNESDEDDNNDEEVFSGTTIRVQKRVKETKPGHIQVVNLFGEDEEDFGDAASSAKPVKMKKLKKRSKLDPKKDSGIHNDEVMRSVELSTFDESPSDSEDLQEILSQKRRNKQKQRKHFTAEQIADEVSMYKRLDAEQHIERASGIVYDDTNEFLSSLKVNLLEKGSHDDMNVVISKEEEHEGGTRESSGEEKVEQAKEEQAENTESKDGHSFNGGIASTLKFLQDRNIIQKQSLEEMEQNKHRREAAREAELIKLRISIEDRLLREELEGDKQYLALPKSEKASLFEKALDQRLREKKIISVPEVRSRHKHSYKQSAESRNYNPQVKLSYRDDSGQELNTKQAFKYLSHQFHGVGPGNNKIDKNLKKRKESGQSVLEEKII